MKKIFFKCFYFLFLILFINQVEAKNFDFFLEGGQQILKDDTHEIKGSNYSLLLNYNFYDFNSGNLIIAGGIRKIFLNEKEIKMEVGPIEINLEEIEFDINALFVEFGVNFKISKNFKIQILLDYSYGISGSSKYVSKMLGTSYTTSFNIKSFDNLSAVIRALYLINEKISLGLSAFYSSTANSEYNNGEISPTPTPPFESSVEDSKSENNKMSSINLIVGYSF